MAAAQPLTATSSALFEKLDIDCTGTISLSEMHCRLSDFGLDDGRIEQLFFALDTNHDGVISRSEFEQGFEKVQAIVEGSKAIDFHAGPVKQWGFAEWKLDRWLEFDGTNIDVYKTQGGGGAQVRPGPGQRPLFTIRMADAKCNVDPQHADRFAVDTGVSIVYFKTIDAATRTDWCSRFSAAGVSTQKELADVISRKRSYQQQVGDYYLGKQIGSGGFAQVHIGVKAETGEAVAAKVMSASTAADPQHRSEIVAMAALQHPNIVKLKDIVYEPKRLGQREGKIYLMLELAPGGELFQQIVDHGTFDEAKARFYFRQIMSGVQYCHQRGICHRDLKLENLLLDASGKVLKITDFGFAKNLSEGVAKTVLGTAVYVAPEVLDGLEYDGYQVDIWACGIVLYVMVAGRYPFDCGHHGGVGPQDKRQNAELMLKLQKAKYELPRGLSPEMVDLFSKLIQPDVTKRLTAKGTLLHPWTLGDDWSVETVETLHATIPQGAVQTPSTDDPAKWLAILNAASGSVVNNGGVAQLVAFDEDEDDDDDDDEACLMSREDDYE